MGFAPVMTATAQVSASSLLLVPLALAIDTPWRLPLPGTDVWFAITALALVSTALAYLLYFRILASAGATNLLLVNFLVPLPAILLGTALLDERLGLVHMAGLVLVGFGLSAVDGRLWQRHPS
jgi:drug/metabolite transporter (DMT)-like permease